MKLHYLEFDCMDPYQNLALEECILNRALPNEIFLYLWQNKNTVVIGKNQNPWRECNLANMERDGCRLARRITGGGAVYHDLGNLNFSFIVPKKVYDLPKQLGIIIGALDAFSIKAEFSGRNDLLVHGSKFSGNAFCHRNDFVLHHGTLLINSDFSRFPEYLNVSNKKMQSKGVASVRSRVANLSQFADITVQNIKEPLIQSFIHVFNGRLEDYPVEGILESDVLKSLAARNQSRDWLYHTSPKFNVTLEERFNWGEVQLFLQVEKGIISEISCYSDSLDEDISESALRVLTGCTYDAAVLRAVLEKSERQLHDIIELVIEHM